MRKPLIILVVLAITMSSFAQLVYPTIPKSTNDATITGKLKYPQSFQYNGNPVSRMHSASDPDVVVWGDTLWVYTSQDRKPSNGLSGYDTMDGYHVFSTTDLVNWINHGEVMHSSDISWARGGFLWAPAAARKNGTYYLYYPVQDKSNSWKVGVAVGKTPIGPFKDSGKPLANISSIDPKIFIDDDGQAYIYNNVTKVAKLKPNMIELAENTKNVVYGTTTLMNDASSKFNEGSYMHKKDGIYYYSYSNFNNKTDQGFYATGKNPYGPFEWKGALAPKANGAQDHHSIVEFKGQWYYFYHITTTGLPQYKEGQGRIFCFDRLYYNKDGTIQKVVETQGPKKILTTNIDNGLITLSPPGGAYDVGTKVTVTAKADKGYVFSSWNGHLTGKTNPTTITMDGDKTIKAIYTFPTAINEVNNSTNNLVTIAQNYPNPFRTSTTIPYHLSVATHVKLTIHNALGQQVASLVDAVQSPGEYNVIWDAKEHNGKPLQSGIYMYCFETNKIKLTGGKLIIIDGF